MHLCIVKWWFGKFAQIGPEKKCPRVPVWVRGVGGLGGCQKLFGQCPNKLRDNLNGASLTHPLFLIFPHIWLGTNVTNYCTYRKAKRHGWKLFHREKYSNNPKLLSEKYDFACFPLFNILHRMSKIHEENIQQQSSYYFLNIETLSLKIIRKVLFLTLSISIAFKKCISRYIPGDGLMMFTTFSWLWHLAPSILRIYDESPKWIGNWRQLSTGSVTVSIKNKKL